MRGSRARPLLAVRRWLLARLLLLCPPRAAERLALLGRDDAVVIGVEPLEGVAKLPLDIGAPQGRRSLVRPGRRGCGRLREGRSGRKRGERGACQDQLVHVLGLPWKRNSLRRATGLLLYRG